MEGKVALVTGGSSGIGRATAMAFARKGAKVLVADVNVSGGRETAQTILDIGGQAEFVEADVSNALDVEAMVERAISTYGRLDYAYNNAGISGGFALTHEYSMDEWNKVIDINLKGVWLCMKYELPQMVKQRGGAIVNTSSINGFVATTGMCGYIASKHGVSGLTKTAAIEYAKSGIRVNAVCPGAINTAMTQEDMELGRTIEVIEVERYPIGRMGEPGEVAEAVVWLCSDAASFVTGHTMVVDGGYIAQ